MKSSDVVARTALTAVLTAAAFWSPAALAAEPTATEYRFAVYYGDRRIGEHRYEIVQDGDATRVRSRADFQVKLLFINAYRYEHQANELWRGGCLTDVERGEGRGRRTPRALRRKLQKYYAQLRALCGAHKGGAICDTVSGIPS